MCSKGIRYDAARAAAYAAWELAAANPGAPETVMLKKLTEVVLYAIEEAQRRLTELRHFTCVGCFRTVTFRDHQEGRRVKCPACGKKQSAPDREGRN
jgi:DNA-directed RNA polymerase subunit RPC12/RpoP